MSFLINLNGTSTYIGHVVESQFYVTQVSPESLINLILEELRLTHNQATLQTLVARLSITSYKYLATAPNFSSLQEAIGQLPKEEQTLFKSFSASLLSNLKVNAVYVTPSGVRVYLARPKTRPIHPADPQWLADLKRQHQDTLIAYRLSDGHALHSVDLTTLKPFEA